MVRYSPDWIHIGFTFILLTANLFRHPTLIEHELYASLKHQLLPNSRQNTMLAQCPTLLLNTDRRMIMSGLQPELFLQSLSGCIQRGVLCALHKPEAGCRTTPTL